MKTRFTITLLFLMLVNCLYAGLSISDLTCEYKTNPLGMDETNPRLGWILNATEINTMQTAYQVQVSLDPKTFKTEPVWDSGKTDSDQSFQIVYNGTDLQSATRYYWRVKVWDNHNNESEWSAPAFWEMGLLSPKDWKATWIRPDLEENLAELNPAPMLRKEFHLEAKVKSARAYITSLGLYEFQLNGKRVGEQVLTPGWTTFLHRIQYQTYDVTNLLKTGDNAVGVTLGDGWYRGTLAWGDKSLPRDRTLKLLMQIEITYTNGKTETIVTDNTWKSNTGPILMSDLFMGETYDARLEYVNWTKSGFDDSEWHRVIVSADPGIEIKAPDGPPVLKIQELKPVGKSVTPEGDIVFDMGQNMVGWLRFKVKGPKGTTIEIRHAEVLDKDGNFYTENLRRAKQTITYTLKGDGVEVFEPHFTWQGFQYFAVKGWPGEPSLEDFTGVVVHSDITPTMEFSCSNPMLNQLQHNIQWGQKGNFVDVPTDCPQRDERMGWTGDAQVFATTACFNADVAGFYTKWLKDMIYDQKESGAIPDVVPNIRWSLDPVQRCGASGWSDAVVVIPWTVYQYYNDTRILSVMYDSMVKWIKFMQTNAGDDYIWSESNQLGDWLSFNSQSSSYPGAYTDKEFIATAYFAYSTGLVAKTAAILGKDEDAKAFTDLREKIKSAFIQEFMTPDGRLSPNTQTAYSLALSFDLIPESLKAKTASRLAANVNEFGHITTGFLGTPLISLCLSNNGYLDEAYMLLNRQRYPSWLYPITRGATTIWERWDGIKPDSTFQTPSMNSYNHYAYGAIGNWMYRTITGINNDPAQPGFKHINIEPQPGGDLNWAKAEYNSLYGPIRSSWKITDGTYTLTLDIPVNTSATIQLPNAEIANIKVNDKSLTETAVLSNIHQQGNNVLLQSGSGHYSFEYKLKE